MKQAIQTRNLSSTFNQCRRIVAFCDRGEIIVPVQSSMDWKETNQAHRDAALKLIGTFLKEDAKEGGPSGWASPFVSGVIKGGDYVHVFLD